MASAKYGLGCIFKGTVMDRLFELFWRLVLKPLFPPETDTIYKGPSIKEILKGVLLILVIIGVAIAAFIIITIKISR